MSDWQVGDLAMCLEDYEPVIPGLVIGSIWTVRSVETGVNVEGKLSIGLTLCEIAPPSPYQLFCADEFRKVRPSAVREVERLKALAGTPIGEAA